MLLYTFASVGVSEGVAVGRQWRYGNSYCGQVQGALRCGLKAVPTKFYDVAFRKRALLHIEVGLQTLGLSEAAYKGGADLNAKCHISRE
jgi:hypothetical protein